MFYRNRFEIRQFYAFLDTSNDIIIQVLPQQEGRWYLCNMHTLTVIRLENYICMGVDNLYIDRGRCISLDN